MGNATSAEFQDGSKAIARPVYIVDFTGTPVLGNNDYFSSNASLTNVASSASSVTLLGANANRNGIYIFNDSTAILYIAYGVAASVTTYVTQVPSQVLFEMPLPIYLGVVNGVWASAVGFARITEMS